MLVLATVCGVAGTWQIARFEQKHAANHHLRADDRDAPVDISAALGPAASPTSDGQAAEVPAGHRHRQLPAGRPDPAARPDRRRRRRLPGPHPAADRSTGVLLVARGFVPQTGAADSSPPVPAAPAGPVTVTARLQPADTQGRPVRPAARPAGRQRQPRRAGRPDRHPGLERLRRTARRPARHRRPAGHPGPGPVQPGRRRRGTAARRLRGAVVPVRPAGAGRAVHPGRRRTAPGRGGRAGPARRDRPRWPTGPAGQAEPSKARTGRRREPRKASRWTTGWPAEPASPAELSSADRLRQPGDRGQPVLRLPADPDLVHLAEPDDAVPDPPGTSPGWPRRRRS